VLPYNVDVVVKVLHRLTKMIQLEWMVTALRWSISVNISHCLFYFDCREIIDGCKNVLQVLLTSFHDTIHRLKCHGVGIVL